MFPSLLVPLFLSITSTSQAPPPIFSQYVSDTCPRVPPFSSICSFHACPRFIPRLINGARYGRFEPLFTGLFWARSKVDIINVGTLT
ncbi:hypothetical protein DFH06DRAFT_1210337 [Mycena polygramma]|nr:hypothetical protein DFH06DRAFT_1210337 [Mycena polygramma]